jgi:glycosyltransferase involved in cell wall biosynthesis
MLSVVIATKDRAAFLARALDSLSLQTSAPPFEAIVVDNGSRDGTGDLVNERIAAAPFPLHLEQHPEPNRGAARNVGIARARGETVVFVDDDVWLPPGFLAAHARAHAGGSRELAVSGPILNVPSYEVRPEPAAANFSRAFFCTCNVSLPRRALEAVGGFDEIFDLYGWEDTELGLRLRRSGIAQAFAWDAYLYHIKPPRSETLETLARKTVERARMAAHLLRKEPTWRARLATGAYAANLLRARVTAPEWLLPLYAGLAKSERAPAAFREIARAQFLDGLYTNELRRVLESESHGPT